MCFSAGITNPQKFRECMKLLKSMIKEGQHLNAEFSNGVDDGQNGKLTNNHLNKKNLRTIEYNNQTRRKPVENKTVLSSNENPDVDVLKVHNNDSRFQQGE